MATNEGFVSEEGKKRCGGTGNGSRRCVAGVAGFLCLTQGGGGRWQVISLGSALLCTTTSTSQPPAWTMGDSVTGPVICAIAVWSPDNVWLTTNMLVWLLV